MPWHAVMRPQVLLQQQVLVALRCASLSMSPTPEEILSLPAATQRREGSAGAPQPPSTRGCHGTTPGQSPNVWALREQQPALGKRRAGVGRPVPAAPALPSAGGCTVRTVQGSARPGRSGPSESFTVGRFAGEQGSRTALFSSAWLMRRRLPHQALLASTESLLLSTVLLGACRSWCPVTSLIKLFLLAKGESWRDVSVVGLTFLTGSFGPEPQERLLSWARSFWENENKAKSSNCPILREKAWMAAQLSPACNAGLRALRSRPLCLPACFQADLWAGL